MQSEPVSFATESTLGPIRIGVLGTGVVGRTIASKLRELGHDVLVGSRSAGDDAVPFAEAATQGHVVSE